jgi:hypothetical protein
MDAKTEIEKYVFSAATRTNMKMAMLFAFRNEINF